MQLERRVPGERQLRIGERRVRTVAGRTAGVGVQQGTGLLVRVVRPAVPVVLVLCAVLVTVRRLILGRVFVTFPVAAVAAVLVRLVRSVRFSCKTSKTNRGQRRRILQCCQSGGFPPINVADYRVLRGGIGCDSLDANAAVGAFVEILTGFQAEFA